GTLHGRGVGVAHPDDGVVALLGQRGEALLLVRVRLAGGGLDVGGLVADHVLRLLQARVGGVVEGLVAAAADVLRDGQPRARLPPGGVRGGGGRGAAAGGESEGQGGGRCACDRDPGNPAHGVVLLSYKRRTVSATALASPQINARRPA